MRYAPSGLLSTYLWPADASVITLSAIGFTFKRHDRQDAGALYSSGGLALVRRAIAGNTPRDQFTSLVDKTTQKSLIFVIHVVDLVFTEVTEFSSS